MCPLTQIPTSERRRHRPTADLPWPTHHTPYRCHCRSPSLFTELTPLPLHSTLPFCVFQLSPLIPMPRGQCFCGAVKMELPDTAKPMQQAICHPHHTSHTPSPHTPSPH